MYFLDKTLETDHLYKKKKYEFYYYTKDELKQIQKENEIKLLGTIFLKHEKKIDEEKYTYVTLNESTDSPFICKIEDTEKHVTIGYIKVENNTYIRVAKKRILPFFLLFLLLLSSVFICLYLTKDKLPNNNDETTTTLPIADGKDWDGKLPYNGDDNDANADSIQIPGYANLYISKENPTIQLVNPDKNSVYFVYKIKENNKILYETDAIEPGKMIEANLIDLFVPGEYELTFDIETYDIENQSACNGSVQKVTLTVKED